MITENPNFENNYPLKFNWENNHPGKNVIRFTTEYMLPILDQEINVIVPFDNNLIHIYWLNSLQMGMVSVLQFQSDHLQSDAIAFSTSIWEIYLNQPSSIDDFSLIKEIKFPDNVSFSYTFDPDWVKISLSGGLISFEIERERINFISRLSNFLIVFRWMYYTLNYVKFDTDNINFIFNDSEINLGSLDQNYYLSVVDPTNDRFQVLLNNVISDIFHVEPKNRVKQLINDLNLVNKITKEEITTLNKLKLFSNNFDRLYKIDTEYSTQEMNNLMIDLSGLSPSEEIIDLLMFLSDSLEHLELIELSKFVNGTILDQLINTDIRDKGGILNKITQKTRILGSQHLIAYIQSLSSILGSSEDDIALLIETTKLVEDDFMDSWEGLLCLVDLYNLTGKGNIASKYRIKAINTNTDPISKSIDVFTAIGEISGYENIDEQEILSSLMQQFEYGIVNLPSGEIFNVQLNNLIVSLITNSKFEIINSIVNWIKYHIKEIGVKDRLSLLKILTVNLSTQPSLTQTLLIIQLIQFNHYLDYYAVSSDQSLLEQADRLLKVIFNGIDPKENRYKEKLTLTTQSLVLSATNYEEWQLIQEALHRFKILVNDEDYYTKAVVQIYMNAGKSRVKLTKEELKNNDIGLKLFDETIRLISQFSNESDLALKFLPAAKDLAIKVRDYKRFTIYSILETNLSKIGNFPWIDILIESVLTLVNKDEINSARTLIDTALSLELSSEEEYEILSRQLEIAETDLDIINVEEITVKRERMIKLALQNPGIVKHDQIIESYRNGISEILSKGSSKHLDTFLLKAIKFGVDNQIDDLDEFYYTLNDSFYSMLENYQSSLTFSAYNEVIYICRELLIINQSNNLSNILPYPEAIIKANHEMYMNGNVVTYMTRNILLFQELAHIIKLNSNISDNDVVLMELKSLANGLLSTVSRNIYDLQIFNIITDLTPFYLAVNEYGIINQQIIKALNAIKKSMIKKKLPSGQFISAIIFLSNINKILIKNNKKMLTLGVVEHAVKLVNVVLTFKRISTESLQLYNELKNQLETNGIKALDNYKMNYIDYLPSIDNK